MAEIAHVTVLPSDVAAVSSARKYTLLLIFCFSQFLDAYNVCSLFSAIPDMTIDLGLTPSDAVWLISAYQLTFAALLLSSGRFSDVYSPKWVFVGGAAALGVLSIISGVVESKIPLFVLRALTGIAAAMTIPSSLTLLVRLFPEPEEQAKAIAAYGGCAALGNALGVVLGAVLVQYATWHWVFHLSGIIAIPIAIIAFILVPKQPRFDVPGGNKIAYLDLPGVGILTTALVLLIFAFTSSGTDGWDSATVIAPLIIAIAGVSAFFWYETRIPADRAAFPPRTWRFPNFPALFFTALTIFLWINAVFLLIITMWQEHYGWSAIKSAVHFLPVGLLAVPVIAVNEPVLGRIDKKYAILIAQTFIFVATILLPFCDAEDKYWRFAFPSFILGSIGCAALFINANVALFANTPKEIAGTIGAIFNSSLQLGSAVGVAVITSIQVEVDKKNRGDPTANLYDGRAAGLWFLAGVIALSAVGVLVFYRTEGQLAQRVTDDESSTRDSATLPADSNSEKERKFASGATSPGNPASRTESKNDGH